LAAKNSIKNSSLGQKLGIKLKFFGEFSDFLLEWGEDDKPQQL
jgi:hypothetical protein